MPGYERYEEYVPSTPEKKSYVGGFLLVLLLAGVIGQGFYSWRLSNRVAELESVVQIQLSSQKGVIQTKNQPADRLARQQQESLATEENR